MTEDRPPLLVTGPDFLKNGWKTKLEAFFRVEERNELQLEEADLLAALTATSAVGYVLGGIEHPTARIFEEAGDLKYVVFTGTAIEEFVPGMDAALARGVRLAATRHANANAVAETTVWSIGCLLSRISYGSPQPPEMGRELAGEDTVVIGRGGIGKLVGQKLSALGAVVDFVTPDTPADYRESLLRRASCVAVCASSSHGDRVLNSRDVGMLKHGAVLVNTAFPAAVDLDALEARARAGELLVGMDSDPKWSDPPPGVLYSEFQNAWQKVQAVERVNSRAFDALLAFRFDLPTGDEVTARKSTRTG